MILLTERIEDSLKRYLQKDVHIIVKDKKLHTGRLVLFRVDGFYIQLIFSDGVNNNKIEIPYPFNILQNKNLFFDYRLESLAEKDFNLLFTLQSISKKRESKFYNNVLEIIEA